MYGRGKYGKARYGVWSYRDISAATAANSTVTATVGRARLFSGEFVADSLVNSPAIVRLRGLSGAISGVTTQWADVTRDPILEGTITSHALVSAEMLRVWSTGAVIPADSATTSAIQHLPTLGQASVEAYSEVSAFVARTLPLTVVTCKAALDVTANLRGRYVDETPSASAPWTSVPSGADIWTPITDTPPVWHEVA